jgi:hypothetical protein
MQELSYEQWAYLDRTSRTTFFLAQVKVSLLAFTNPLSHDTACISPNWYIRGVTALRLEGTVSEQFESA